jgi:adenylylsulfate kinase
MIVAMAGLPATGKSALACCLADELPAVVLDKDAIRAALFPPSEIEYSLRQDDFCLGVMMSVAEYILRKDPGKHIILDGRTFSRRYQLEEWKKLADELGVPFAVIECTCAEQTAKRRLTRDIAQGRHVATNRTYEMYLSVKARFEPIPAPKLVVDTDQDLERCISLALQYLRDRA